MTAALTVMGFMELPEDDVPPEEIWHHPERLEEWFAAVKQRREHGTERIDSNDEEPMTRNEHVAELMGDRDDG